MRTSLSAARTMVLAAALALAAGCDADRDPAAIDDDAALPDGSTPPVDTPAVPPPAPRPDAPPDPPRVEATVPTRFQGSYAASADACDTTGDASHLDIGGDTIAFHESSGPVTEVASGPSDLTVTARLTGEGQTREATYRFRLSDDGATLTDLGGGMERVRCD